jgi:3-phosphoshikimate 1-carboxyvinyltransferase
MGVEVETENGSVRVRRSNLQAIVMDATDCPDLVPPVAAIACYAQGKTKIMNAERLRTKESNRLSALSSELRKMGAEIRETADGLEIAGGSALKGAKVSSHDDHRIAMTCSVAALGAKGETMIDGARCIAKSYPVFFDDLESLGGDIRGWK